MYHKKSEKGQAIIMIVVAMIGLIGMTGLTVDGGMAFSDHRHAQNAADSAAFAGALANSKNQDIETAAQSIATANGYNNDQVQNIVVITISASPTGTCPYETPNNKDINVDITSYVKTFFAPIVGVKTLTNRVNATTRACGLYFPGIFGGNAIVSLNPGPDCAFNSDTGNAEWNLTGGGIFSNSCAVGKNNVHLDAGDCVAAVDGATGFTGSTCPGTVSPYDQSYIDSQMPPNPCDHTAGDVGIFPPAPVGNADVEYSNGVYCISNFDTYDKLNINLVNATLYVTDPSFNVNFSGSGGFSGTPTQSGDFSSYYMVILPDPSDPTCSNFQSQNGDQVLRYVGNGLGALYGTVLAPGACVDLRGNGSSAALNSQIVAYNVSANGDATTSIDYNDKQNRRNPVYPSIELIK